MATFKIQAGATFDTVTKKEMEDALGSHMRSWVAEMTIGGRFTRFAVNGTIAGSAITIGGANGSMEPIGPPPGFIWDVRRLHISGLAAADIAGVYINDVSAAGIVATTTDLPLAANRTFLWSGQVVLMAGENLLVTGTSLSATGQVTVSGQVLELPVSLAWKLV